MITPPKCMSKSLRIKEIIENLFYTGLSGFTMWEFAVAELKINADIVSEPILLQIYCMINQLNLTFSKSIHLSDVDFSQEKLPYFLEKEHTLNELFSQLKSEINKKTFKDKLFSLEYDCSKTYGNSKKIVLKKTQPEQKPKENKRKKVD